MSVPLGDALQNVELKIGRTYRCEVNGRWVELRVLAECPDRAESMFDPWVEFPLPTSPFRIRAKAGRQQKRDHVHSPRRDACEDVGRLRGTYSH